MQLDKLQLDLRPRPNWQAIDLGQTLLRAHWRPAYLAWLSLWLPLLGLILAVHFSYGDSTLTAWMMFAAWWLRPALERVVIYILARRVFGDAVGAATALRAWPSQLRGGLFRLLTWQRLISPGRAFYQGIWQLEGARGKPASIRRRLLGRDGAAHCAQWYGFCCAQFELVLSLGLIAAASSLIAPSWVHNPLWLLDSGPQYEWLKELTIIVAFGLAVALVGPIYCAGCFTLYLNRRAVLEAWDIEIGLRQFQPPPHLRMGLLTPAHSASTSTLGKLLGALALLPMLCLLQPSPLQADELSCTTPPWISEPEANRPQAHNPDQQAFRNRLRKVFDHPDLRGYVCETQWQRKDKQKDEPPESPGKIPGWLPDFIRWILIVCAASVFAWLLYRYRSNWLLLLKLPQKSPRTPPMVMGMDLRPQSLPDNICASVLQLWRSGAQRDALALLYRATLSRLVSHYALPLQASDTEGDCLRRASGLSGPLRQLLQQVSQVWIAGAYAHQWPTEDSLQALCQQWQILEVGQ